MSDSESGRNFLLIKKIKLGVYIVYEVFEGGMYIHGTYYKKEVY